MMKMLQTPLHQNTNGKRTRKEREWEVIKNIERSPKIHHQTIPNQSEVHIHHPHKYVKNTDDISIYNVTSGNQLTIDGRSYISHNQVCYLRENRNLLTWLRTNDTTMYIFWDNQLYTFSFGDHIVSCDVFYDTNKKQFVILYVNDLNMVYVYNDYTLVHQSLCDVDILDIFLTSSDGYMILTSNDYTSFTDICTSKIMFPTKQITFKEDVFIYDVIYLPKVHRFFIKTHESIFIVDRHGMNLFSEKGLHALHAAITTEKLVNNMVYDCNTLEGYTFNRTEEVLFYVSRHHLYFAQTIPPYDIQFIYMFPSDNFRIYKLMYNDNQHKLWVSCNGKRYEFSLF